MQDSSKLFFSLEVGKCQTLIQKYHNKKISSQVNPDN